MLFHRSTKLVLCAAIYAIAASAAAQSFDIVVYGGTPGGIAAALAAARSGRTVALIEYQKHLGGMAASGLGKSDIETREAIGGLFREFVGRVHRYYVEKYGPDSQNVKLSRDGYYYEPSVAERIFGQMIAEQPKIQVFRNHRLEEVWRSGLRVSRIRTVERSTGAESVFRAQVFIDGTYEGDLAAFAGARYRTGREARADFNELHAGVVYQDPTTRTFLAGTTGEGDKRIQAYTYRLCLTTDPANSAVMRNPPPEYDRTRYLPYLEDWKAGRLGKPDPARPESGYLLRAFTIAPIPNGKTDVNMYPRVLAYPFVEENYDYPEAGWQRRERIAGRIRNITLGLLYFLQNDEAVPADHRALARRYHMARDEFQDNENFPWQLYVREARRLVGLYTLSENDVISGADRGRARVHSDAITAGEYPIDSMPVRKRQPKDDVILEGYLLMLKNITRPYQIPYRIMVPETVDALLAPVAASTTHIAFSSIRLEPTWMALGHAAGLAAHLAIESAVQPRAVDIERLQRTLLDQHQILTYFHDIDLADPAHRALQYFGTKGFFPDYTANSRQPLERKIAVDWLARVRPGAQLKGSGPHVTRDDVESLAGGKPWRDPKNTTGTAWRGEFCRALYSARQH